MKILALAALFVLVNAKHEQYIGWKSYNVGPASQDQLFSLNSYTNQLKLDFLSRPTGQNAGIVLVQPDFQSDFISTLEDLEITYSIHADDVKTQLDLEDEINESWTKRGSNGSSLPYDDYQDLDAIVSYLNETTQNFPETVTLVDGGSSSEGRSLYYLKISSTNFTDEAKPIIVIDAGIHAREWISIPVATWVINKLTEDLDEPDLLEKFDWIVVPVVNPDGYVYSRESDRLWRKTRSNDTATNGTCVGVDANRNFDHFWNTEGTSQDPCDETYAGPEVFSEPESQFISEIINENLARIALYLTLHSYGSTITYPWSHRIGLSNNALGLHAVGIAIVNGIQELALPNFPRYEVGNSALSLGELISGSSDDYAHSIGVPLTLTIRLPGNIPRSGGFTLDPAYIQQVCDETWRGINAGARRAGDLVNQ